MQPLQAVSGDMSRWRVLEDRPIFLEEGNPLVQTEELLYQLEIQEGLKVAVDLLRTILQS